jgi:hypothetical protein
MKTELWLAHAHQWSTDEKHHRSCSAAELVLFGEMCVASDYSLDGECELTDNQLVYVVELGVQHGVPEDKCGRFFRRMCDIVNARKHSVAQFSAFWRAMRRSD